MGDWKTKAFKRGRFDAILKVGGSVIWGHAASGCADALEEAGRTKKLLVIPGGGAPDNLIEKQHNSTPLDGRVFHQMTLLAQDQSGLLFSNKRSHIVPVRTVDEAELIASSGKVAVLLPHNLLMTIDVFRYTNRVTSDSMAAYVAGLLRCDHFILVKSRKPSTLPVTKLSLMADAGYVDEVFPEMVEANRYECLFADIQDIKGLALQIQDLEKRLLPRLLRTVDQARNR